MVFLECVLLVAFVFFIIGLCSDSGKPDPYYRNNFLDSDEDEDYSRHKKM